MKITELQVEVMRKWTPETCVPPFDENAVNRNAGQWNYSQPNETKGKKHVYHPPKQTGVPNPARFDEFLEKRINSAGGTLLSQFEPRVEHDDGWWCYESESFDAARLPKKSGGPLAHENYGKPSFVTHFHGCKIEGLYSILECWDVPGKGLRASANKDQGDRYLSDGGEGVYGHRANKKSKAFEYSRWVPLFADGTYVRAYLEMECDVDWRVVRKHADQKIICSNQHALAAANGVIEPGVCPGGPAVYYAKCGSRSSLIKIFQ